LVKFLASVTSIEEARLCAGLRVDIIDCKNPADGAPGALPIATVAAIRRSLPGAVVSATVGVGDLPSVPETAVAAVTAMAATGVDYLKVGLSAHGQPCTTIGRIGALRLDRARVVGLLLADRELDLTLIPGMGRAGFAGVMLDTADKAGPALPELLDAVMLERFISAARRAGLFAGLAGSLRTRHIAQLLALGVEVLGFRGALCRGRSRSAAIDADAVAAMRRLLPRHAAGGSAPVAHAGSLEQPRSWAS
jgi:uncharacterized protein (UPF0264 family)